MSGQAASEENSGFRVEAGYRFPREDFAMTAAEQRRKHGYCDIDEAVYGEYVDPTFIARRPITLNTEAITACHPENGVVHTVHRIRQMRPVPLGETLAMTGEYAAVEDAPRGWVLKSRWEFRDAAGKVAVAVEPDILMVDPARAPQPGGRKGKGTPPDDAGFEALTEKQCTPETTLGYCEGSQNKIHLEPDVAKEFGFRAPIIAGNQTVNFLLEGLAADGVPAELDVTLRFLRPVFWDDAIAVVGRRGADGRLEELRALNGDGKIVGDCHVASITYVG